MSPCPLCLLGFATPHTAEMWRQLERNEALQFRLEKLLKARGPSIVLEDDDDER